MAARCHRAGKPRTHECIIDGSELVRVGSHPPMLRFDPQLENEGHRFVRPDTDMQTCDPTYKLNWRNYFERLRTSTET